MTHEPRFGHLRHCVDLVAKENDSVSKTKLKNKYNDKKKLRLKQWTGIREKLIVSDNLGAGSKRIIPKTNSRNGKDN